MSQNGAYAYANQGYDYRQILGVYYPGVAIPQSGRYAIALLKLKGA